MQVKALREWLYTDWYVACFISGFTLTVQVEIAIISRLSE